MIRIPAAWLEQNAAGRRDDVHCYWKGCYLARYWMWERLEKLSTAIARLQQEGSVLDVGGGLGILLPTLHQFFGSVTLLDRETSVARKVCEKYELKNVTICEEDLLSTTLPASSFDAIVAAAFLEHFRQTEEPLAQIYKLLKPGGLLFVDLPTENWIYVLGRKLGGIEKPPDHYHSAAEIRPHLLKQFELVQESHIPFRPCDLYYQAVLRKR